MTAALKSLNANFSIAMTGTPVENSLADLWSIADVIAPGMLPALKEFARTYTVREPESLERLSRALLGSGDWKKGAGFRHLRFGG